MKSNTDVEPPTVLALHAEDRVRLPIGAKIFSVIVLLLLLMASVTYISTTNLQRLDAQLQLLSEYYIPLDQIVSHVRINHLQQIRLFENLLISQQSHMLAEIEQESQRFLPHLLPCTAESLRDTNQTIRREYPRGGMRTALIYETSFCVLKATIDLHFALYYFCV